MDEEKMLVDGLDDKDLMILRLLQDDARLTTKEVASRLHLSMTPVYERVRRLEREGYIKKFVAVLDAEKLGHGFMVFCWVKLRQMNRDIALSFEDEIKALPEVTECYNTSGEFDYMLKVHARDMKHYKDFLIGKLGTIESVGSIQSSFVMNEIKQSYGLAL